MGIAYIDVTYEQKKITKTAKNNLFWYDSDNKKLLKFEGTRLDFKYDPSYSPNFKISSKDFKSHKKNIENLINKSEELDNSVIIYINENNKNDFISYFINNQILYHYNSKLKISSIDIPTSSYQSSTNHEKIIKWIEDNKEEYGLSIVSADSKTVAIEFDDEKKEDFEDSLYRERFNFEVL